MPRPRLIDRPLHVQFLLAGGIVAFFSVVTLALLLLQVRRQTVASRWLGETHQEIARLHTFGMDLVKERTAFEDVARARKTGATRVVREAREATVASLSAVEKLMSGDGPESAMVKDLRQAYESWTAFTTTMLLSPDPSAFEREESLFRQVFSGIDRIVGAETRELTIRDHSEKSAIESTFTGIAALNVALLLIFGIVLAKLYLSIARPISALSQGIDLYHKGDFGARVTVESRSQVGVAVAAFNEMAEKIEAMVADLRKLDEMKSEFISTVSHELRTPLTSIGGYVKLLVSGDAGPVTETQKEFLFIIDTNVVRLTHLINDILDIEKMESGKVQLNREPQDLVTVLQECRQTFQVVAEQKGLELKFKAPATLKPVLGDHPRLVQVFMNLLSNAVKYTEKGSIELEAEERDFAIVVRVRDTGVGLTAAERERIFQKFYRARGGLASSEGGTGLGLAIVRGLVDAHGGKVTVDSEPGKGTTFTVTLPVAPVVVSIEEAQGIFVPEEHRDSALIRDVGIADREWVRMVWLVDENEADAHAVARLLEGAGPIVRGHAVAVKLFRRVEDLPKEVPHAEQPVLVICAPPGGKSPLVRELRVRMHRTVPIVVLGAPELDTAATFSDGATALIRKPAAERELLAVVKDALATKGWKVLVADHNTDMRILIKRALEQRGFKVDDVDRGSLVLGRLEKEEYDLALVDMNFPDVSGVDILKVIRRDKRMARMPVFVMLDQDETLPSKAELEAWGADHFVGKYRGIGGIVDSVVQYLEDRKLSEQRN